MRLAIGVHLYTLQLLCGAVEELFRPNRDEFLRSPGETLKAKIEVRELIFELRANVIDTLPQLTVEALISKIDKEDGLSLLKSKVNCVNLWNLYKLLPCPKAQGLKLRPHGLRGKPRGERQPGCHLQSSIFDP